MAETEKDAYIEAESEYREAQQTRIALKGAVDYAEIVELKVGMAPNSSAVLVSATQGFLTTLKVALAEAYEAEKSAEDKAAKEYNAMHTADRGWGTSLQDLEDLRRG